MNGELSVVGKRNVVFISFFGEVGYASQRVPNGTMVFN